MRFDMGRCRGGEGGLETPLPLENHVAIGFLKNTGTDPPQEAIGPLRSNCIMREGSMALC